MDTNHNTFNKYRLQFQPKLPKALQNFTEIVSFTADEPVIANPQFAVQFAKTSGQPVLHFKAGQATEVLPLKVGVVLSGGQAPGGHNVITGLFDALKKLNPQSRVFGFLDGPEGIVSNKYIEITEPLIGQYRNVGGFDMIGSGRTKIETPEQFTAAEKAIKGLDLDGLVIIGGDDSNTNAAFLAEYILNKGVKTKVIGVPKTIDGDLKNEWIEASFGFDTATKTYSQIIGNLQRDTLSAKKYYYFVKLMGRSASHITLECALQTHPNIALISEEVEEQGKTLADVVKDIADVICARAQQGKDYGVVLIPEGIIEFIPECKVLMKELNALMAEGKTEQVEGQLSAESKKCFASLPQDIQKQLLLDRDPHGNVQVSKIETERLLIEMVKNELKQRKKEGSYDGKFSPQPHFCGYEGRSCYPSNFDAQYCYALGHVAALLIQNNATGYIACLTKLAFPTEEWQPVGIPLLTMMTTEQRHGKSKTVIKKALVELKGKPFLRFAEDRLESAIEDNYRYPGPVQYYGPVELTDAITITLQLENDSKRTKEVGRRDLETTKRHY